MWAPFKQAFLVWDRGAHDEEAWKRTNCRRAWWLFSDGRTEDLCVPYLANAGLGLAVLPTRAGLLLVKRAYRSRSEGGGLYLASGERLERVVAGWIHTDGHGLAVSPDGCRVAFAYAPTEERAAGVGEGRLTAKVAEVCKRTAR